MAKLPTRENLGALPSIRSERGIASLNPKAPGSSASSMYAAASAIESGVANLGKGIASLSNFGDVLYQKQLQQEEYDAERKFQEFRWARQQDLEERQRNAPVGAPQFAEQFQQDYYKGASELLGSLPESQKAAYDKKLRDTDIQFSHAAQQFQFGEQKRAATIEHNNTLNGVHSQRARLVPTEALNREVKDYERLVDMDPRLSSVEKDEQKRAGREAIALSHIESRPPEERVAILDALGQGGMKAKLSWRESKNRPNAENELGYAGLWQFGAPRLATIGLYAPGQGENVSDRAARGGWSGRKWSGEFSIPGFPEVKTLQDFKNNPRAQEVAFDIHAQRMDQEIAQNGFDRFIGQKVGGVEITRDGLYGMLHLGGVTGTKNALEKGIVAKDDNKTSVLDYARMGTEGTGTPLDVLPREKIKALKASALTELNAERVQREHNAVLAQKERKRVEDEAENRWVTQALTPGANVSIAEMAKDPALSPEAKQKLFGFIERVGRMDKTATTYGSEFYSLFQRVHAPEGDPNRITDPAVLYDHVREGGGLTLSGMEKLRAEMAGKRTPEGAAEGDLKKQFFANARSQITGSNEGLNLKDPKGDELYLKFMAQSLAEYEAGKKAGKSASAMLNPDSPDYIGKSITTYKRPMSQWFGDTIADKPAAAPARFDPVTVNTLADLQKAHADGFVTAMEARAIAVQRGWAMERNPSTAPAAPVTVPLSQ